MENRLPLLLELDNILVCISFEKDFFDRSRYCGTVGDKVWKILGCKFEKSGIFSNNPKYCFNIYGKDHFKAQFSRKGLSL